MQDELTIAIPVYNRTTYFCEALESAIAQTPSVQILVVDNASDQADFKSIVQRYNDPRIRYVRNEKNLGMAGNWNRCVELCKTSYICLLHDDDKLSQDFAPHIQKGIDKGSAIIFTRNAIINEESEVTYEITPQEFARFKDLREWCVYNRFHTGIVFRVDSCLRAGSFRSSLRFTLDNDMWVRLALDGGVYICEQLGGYYRVYDSGNRATSALEARFETSPRIHIQLRRNIFRYRNRFPGDDPPKMKYCFLGFRQLLGYWKVLPRRRAIYALAVYVNSESSSISGRLARKVMRIAGKAICDALTLKHKIS